MERKIKYDLAFKLKCVQEVLEKHGSFHSVSHQESISQSLLRKWITDCQNQGTLGLEPKRNRMYSLEFKLGAIKSISKANLS